MSVLPWYRVRPVTIAVLRSGSFRVVCAIVLHYAIVSPIEDWARVTLLWVLTLLSIFVSFAVGYEAARLERLRLLDEAEAYFDECDAKAIAD